MKLHLLGTTGYHPNNRRHTACMMLPELGVLLDAGSGMFRVRDLLKTPTLDVFLTHTHLDHVFGLTFIFDIVRNRKMERLTVHAQPDKLAAIDDHLLSPDLFPVKLPFQWRPLADEVILADGARLTHFPVDHPGGSIGFRIDWPDRSLAYVTDTTAKPDSPYIEKIRGADVLLHECYFPDGMEDQAELTGHSCTTPVAQVAKAAGVGRLILVHVDPTSEADDPIGINVARAIFPNTQIAEDMMVVEF